MNTYSLNLSEYTPPKPTENRRDEWVTYGVDNSYYDFLIECFNNSPTNNAIIENICKLVYGQGLTNEVPLISKSTLRKSIKDYKMMGQFAWQIIKSNGKIVKITHLPIQLIAPQKCNEKGQITGYWYSNNWKNKREHKPKFYPKFSKSTNNEIEILYYGNYTVGQKYFANVDYIGALPYCKLEQAIAEYLINEVDNSFSPTLVINNNSGITDEEKQRLIVKKTKETFTGKGGSKIIYGFNSDESKKTTIDSIPLNDAPEHYRYVSEEAQQKILTGHNVVSPMLFGIYSSNGFSSNADEIKNASLLFESMVIKPIREVFADVIEEVTGIKTDFLSLQPVEFKTETPVQLSEVCPTSLGHELDPLEWELVSVQKVDYENEDALDLEVQRMNETKLQKIIKLVSTGTARTKSRSEQDTDKYITRYRYMGEISDKSRLFCKKMIQANKLYRKEDILAMNEIVVNETRTRLDGTEGGLGAYGNVLVDVWQYKGGGACHHYWQREMYKRIGTGKNTQATPSTPAQVRKNGEIAPTNPNIVYQRPIDMPNKGFIN